MKSRVRLPSVYSACTSSFTEQNNPRDDPTSAPYVYPSMSTHPSHHLSRAPIPAPSHPRLHRPHSLRQPLILSPSQLTTSPYFISLHFTSFTAVFPLPTIPFHTPHFHQSCSFPSTAIKLHAGPFASRTLQTHRLRASLRGVINQPREQTDRQAVAGTPAEPSMEDKHGDMRERGRADVGAWSTLVR